MWNWNPDWSPFLALALVLLVLIWLLWPSRKKTKIASPSLEDEVAALMPAPADNLSMSVPHKAGHNDFPSQIAKRPAAPAAMTPKTRGARRPKTKSKTRKAR